MQKDIKINIQSKHENVKKDHYRNDNIIMNKNKFIKSIGLLV